MKKEQDSKEVQKLTISAKELAVLLGISLRQVWRLDSTGKIPKSIRLGGSVKWSQAEIMEWFNSGCPDREKWNLIKGAKK